MSQKLHDTIRRLERQLEAMTAERDALSDELCETRQERMDVIVDRNRLRIERDALAAQVAAWINRTGEYNVPWIAGEVPAAAAKFLAADRVAQEISALDYRRADHWAGVTGAVSDYRKACEGGGV